MWLGIFSALSVSLCILCALVAIYAARTATRAPESLEQRLHSVELQQRSSTTSLTELSTELEALAQRVKMQRVRNATNHASRGNGAPDPYSDPDAWRQAMNRRLAFGKLPPE